MRTGRKTNETQGMRDGKEVRWRGMRENGSEETE